jgi:hypothetical protein
MIRTALETRSSTDAGIPCTPMAPSTTGHPCAAARSSTSRRSRDAELRRGGSGRSTRSRETGPHHLGCRRVDGERHGGRVLDRGDKPGDGGNASIDVVARFVNVEVQVGGSGIGLATSQKTHVAAGQICVRATDDANEHRRLDVLDPQPVAGSLERGVGNGNQSVHPLLVNERQGGPSVRQRGHASAVPQEDARRVDVLADHDETTIDSDRLRSGLLHGGCRPARTGRRQPWLSDNGDGGTTARRSRPPTWLPRPRRPRPGRTHRLRSPPQNQL